MLADEAALRRVTAFPLWDFSGINNVTIEHVPDLYNLTPMKWWWEPSHYQSAAGNMMLDRMLGYSDPGRAVPDDFGIRLSPSNIDAWMGATRRNVKNYVEREQRESAIVYNAVRPNAEAADGVNCGEDESAIIAGVEALKKGDGRIAEAAFEKAMAIHASEKSRSAEIGVPYRENDFERKLRLARSGSQLLPKLTSWIDYQNRANGYLSTGQLEDAIEDLSKAIRLAPPNAALFFLRGTSRLRLGRHASATEDFVAGLAIDPGNVTLQALLKQANTTSGDAVITK